MLKLAELARRARMHMPPPARQEEGEVDRLREETIIEALKTIYDPEIPVNIYDLGLIYAIDVDTEGRVEIRMTLTAPACPVAGSMPGIVADTVRQVDGVSDVHVELVWDPPWSVDLMSDEARLALNMFD
jgi:FeS assembly SUF system protein